MNPIIGTIVCCARPASGHVTAALPSSVINSRRFKLIEWHSITR